MRYIIEVDNEKTDRHLRDFLADNKIEIVDKYEPIEQLSTEVEKLGRALKAAKANPGNWHMLNYYLRGRGISQSTVDGVMKPITDFFRSAGIEIEIEEK